jgi:UMF1 family MFS transporter
MMLVNVDRGRTEGTALARKLEDLIKVRDAASTNQQGTLSQDVRDDLQESFSYQRS